MIDELVDDGLRDWRLGYVIGIASGAVIAGALVVVFLLRRHADVEVAALVGSPGALWAIACAIQHRRTAGRAARVRHAVIEQPDTVAQIAYRHRDGRAPSYRITMQLGDGTTATLRYPEGRGLTAVDALAARCPGAVVHAGRLTRGRRALPVARVVTPK